MFQVHQMVEQYMEKCAMSAAEQAMLDLKRANKAEPASPRAPPSSSRLAAQASGTSLRPIPGLEVPRLRVAQSQSRGVWLSALSGPPF